MTGSGAGRAAVVGAGIGGLAAAAGLRQQGWELTVLERARILEPVGAGLGLAPNALHALVIALRNTGIWLAGRIAPAIMVRQLAPIAGWTPPALGPAPPGQCQLLPKVVTYRA